MSGALRRWPAVLAVLGLMVLGASAAGRAERAPLRSLSTAQSDYIEYCAGCHGIQGSSEPARIPRLAGRVGYFLCLPEGRDYLIRLPNVAHAAIADPQELADMMNFVVFTLGGDGIPDGTRPYTGEEVARLRPLALKTGTSLAAVRAALVEKLIRRCGAPETLRAN